MIARGRDAQRRDVRSGLDMALDRLVKVEVCDDVALAENDILMLGTLEKLSMPASASILPR